MNGVVLGLGECINCHRPFTFNPARVPSVRVNGEREPICQACVDWANPIRRAQGLPEIVVLPGAYEAGDEAELDD